VIVIKHLPAAWRPDVMTRRDNGIDTRIIVMSTAMCDERARTMRAGFDGNLLEPLRDVPMRRRERKCEFRSYDDYARDVSSPLLSSLAIMED